MSMGDYRPVASSGKTSHAKVNRRPLSKGNPNVSPFTIKNKSQTSVSSDQLLSKKDATRKQSLPKGSKSIVSQYGSGHVPHEQSLEERLADLGIEIGTKPLVVLNLGTQIKPKGVVENMSLHPDDDGIPSNQDFMVNSINSALNSPGADSGISRESSDASDRKSARLSSDITKKISEVSSSMDQYDKTVKNVSDTMQEAYRKSVHDMRIRSSTYQAEPIDSAESFILKCRDDLKKDLDSGRDFVSRSISNGSLLKPGPDGDNLSKILPIIRNPRKIYGLGSVAMNKSTSTNNSESGSSESSDTSDTTSSSEETDDDDDNNDTEERAAMKISIRHPDTNKMAALKAYQGKKGLVNTQPGQFRQPRNQLRRHGPRENVDDEDPDKIRSLSPIRPSLADKQFHNMLERREERVTRKLTTMKNELAQLNNKVEMDRKKASFIASSAAARKGVMETSYQGRPLRLMKADKSTANQYKEYLQSTGGLAGGWERKDHDVFVKTFDIWRKHPNKLMEALRKELPNKKMKEIGSHVKWFERFEELSKANKADIHKWSQEKRKENEIVYQMSSESQRAKLEGDKRRQEHLRMIREQERDKSKEKLAQWKRSQTVRSATATCSSPRQHRPRSNFEDKTSGSIDIPEVRKHILEITAKVHALDNPKRDFRPPRAHQSGVIGKGNKDKQENNYIQQLEPGEIRPMQSQIMQNGKRIGFSRSFTNMKTATYGFAKEVPAKLEDDKGVKKIARVPGVVDELSRGSVRLPEIPISARSNPKLRKNTSAQFRERDNRLVEAKKKAVEIARERRTGRLSQLTAEDIRRKIRSRAGPTTILNPTKQSELRKSITHLERLERLSSQDLSHLTQGANEPRFDPALPPINTISSKGVPNWRKPNW